MEPCNEVDTLAILLVQDDRPTALAWARHFHGVCGFAVYVAFDSIAALKVITRYPPDIIIADMGLPYPDGFEVAQRIRALPIGKRPFLIAVTRDQGAAFRRRAEAAGFDLYLVKPVEGRALSQVFRGRAGLVPPMLVPGSLAPIQLT
jgi:CheY-like chemotaxis protein